MFTKKNNVWFQMEQISSVYPHIKMPQDAIADAGIPSKAHGEGGRMFHSSPHCHLRQVVGNAVNVSPEKMQNKNFVKTNDVGSSRARAYVKVMENLKHQPNLSRKI